MIECAQCTQEAIDYCVDCDDDLCGDCCMLDIKRQETVCESCLTNRENEGDE